VDLVEEEDRPCPRRPEPLARTLQYLSNVLHRRGHCGELLEGRTGGLRDDPRECRLARARRSVEDRRAHAILLDRATQHRPFAQHVLLADELVERARPQPLCEWRDRVRALRRSVREEVTHARSMLRTWP
jgi:hypothetical protein